MKEVTLPFGRGTQHVALPEAHILYDLHGNQASVEANPADAVLQSLRQPIGSAPLRDIVRAGDRVAIIVSDITRLCHTDIMLPVIVRELNDVGIADDHITVIIAQGTHRAQTHAEDVTVCGEEMVRRLRIVQHDCRNPETLTCIGKTSRGTEVTINSAAVAADKVILTGAVTFHPLAGFGGGRKAVLPGIAAYDSIMHNHALVLSEAVGGGCNPHCDTSLVEGNPMHEDMKEAAALLKPDFLVNMVFTAEGEIHEVVSGHWYEAWQKGCQDLLDIAGVPIKEQADVVIGSAGGFPKDLNLYQACKAHMNAIFALKPGGILILALECPDIKEPAVFTDSFFRDDLEQFEKDLRAEFTIPAFVAFKTRKIIETLQGCYIVTRKENFDIISQTGEIPAADLETAWQQAEKQLLAAGKTHYTITIMEHASATFPVMK